MAHLDQAGIFRCIHSNAFLKAETVNRLSRIIQNIHNKFRYILYIIGFWYFFLKQKLWAWLWRYGRFMHVNQFEIVSESSCTLISNIRRKNNPVRKSNFRIKNYSIISCYENWQKNAKWENERGELVKIHNNMNKLHFARKLIYQGCREYISPSGAYFDPVTSNWQIVFWLIGSFGDLLWNRKNCK